MWDAAGEVKVPLNCVEVARRASQAALLTGTYDRAIALAKDVIKGSDERADPAGAALGHARLGHILWLAGRGEEAALREYSVATALMPTEPPSAERAFMLAAEAQVLLRCNRRAASAVRCEQALEIARAVNAPAVEAHVLNTSSPNLSAVGEYERAVEAATQARAIARRRGLAEEIGRSYINGSDYSTQRCAWPPAAVPDRIDFVDALPRTGLGKPRRGQVRARMQSQRASPNAAHRER